MSPHLYHKHNHLPGFIRRLAEMGLTPNTEIKITRRSPFRGPIEIEVRGVSLALGYGLASKILIKPIKKDGISLVTTSVVALIIWVGLNAIISGIFCRDMGCFIGFMIIFALAILYVFGILAIYTVAKRQNRNTVRWTTAAIVFSPVIVWIIYGLSWSKNQ